MALVKVFRDSNYLSGQLDITENTPSLSARNFNDKISSVIVESGTFTMYQNSNYDGWSVTVSAKGGPNSDGKYPNSSTFGEHNDKVSSIKLNAE